MSNYEYRSFVGGLFLAGSIAMGAIAEANQQHADTAAEAAAVFNLQGNHAEALEFYATASEQIRQRDEALGAGTVSLLIAAGTGLSFVARMRRERAMQPTLSDEYTDRP